MNGLSTNRRCTSAAACLVQNGVEFVVRYYSETTKQSQKRLLPDEARALHAAGLRIAVVYQDRQTQVEDFSRASGERDGRFAFAYGRENGQPLGTTIFFAVDYDAKPADLRAIQAYFQGVGAGLATAAQSEPSYQVGVYGSGYVCRRLKEAGLVSHTWLAESTGYRESAGYSDWTLKQFVTNEDLCGLPARSWQRCQAQGADRSWSFRLEGAAPRSDPTPVPEASREPELRRHSHGEFVVTLQRLLNRWLLQEGATPLLEDGDFGQKTYRAVYSFQSSNVDNFGQPLVVDGIVGGLTWGALRRISGSLPDPASHPLVLSDEPREWWKQMPDSSLGGSPRARAALQQAVAEAVAGRGESGGNNQGPDIEKYLNGIVDPPANWCAAFVCWCLRTSGPMPFPYTVAARRILSQARRAKLFTYDNPGTTPPLPGDLIVWWRNRVDSWEGHTGIVHHAANGRLYVIEGNKTAKVEGFDYPLVGLEKLLGFVRL